MAFTQVYNFGLETAFEIFGNGGYLAVAVNSYIKATTNLTGSSGWSNIHSAISPSLSNYFNNQFHIGAGGAYHRSGSGTVGSWSNPGSAPDWIHGFIEFGGVLYAGSRSQVVRWSNDNGVTWPGQTTLPPGGAGFLNDPIRDFFTLGGYLYCIRGAGVYRTTTPQTGTSWTAVYTTNSCNKCLWFDGKLFVACNGGYIIYTSNGTTWNTAINVVTQWPANPSYGVLDLQIFDDKLWACCDWGNNNGKVISASAPATSSGYWTLELDRPGGGLGAKCLGTNDVASPTYIFVSFQDHTLWSTGVSNLPPTAPTDLEVEGSPGPVTIDTLTPEFTFVFNDPDSGDLGKYYQIEVNDDEFFGGTVMWNSGQYEFPSYPVEGTECDPIEYNHNSTGLPLAEGTTYYWRVKCWDDYPLDGPLSVTSEFTTGTVIPYAPSQIRINGEGTGAEVTRGLFFTAVYSDPYPPSDTALYYQVQVSKQSDFLGGLMWDSGKQPLKTPVAIGERCENIQYNGYELTPGETYYVRMKFWDNDDNESPWSAVT